MPTSCPRQIPHVIDALLAIQPAPQTILDIGIGCGKYGVLAREYLQIWNHYFEPWGSVPLHLTGIEAHEQYLGPIARAAYDRILVGDALEIVPALESFDAALLIDTLEHFTPEEGGRLLAMLAERCRTTIVALPTTYVATLPVWGNDREVHRCTWTVEQLRPFGDVAVHRNDDALVARIIHGGRA